MCLLDVLHGISREYGWTVCAAHFNHCLRGEESDRDENFVSSHCAAAGIPFYSAREDVSLWAEENHMGTEAAGRERRYRFLETIREKTGAVFIATAHNADDNAETVLMHLLRGTGTAGLCGIQPQYGRVIRPLLSVSRSEIEEYNIARGIPWIEDSTNGDDSLLRNRLRHQVIPVLKDMNPAFTDACRRTLLAALDEKALSALAEEAARPYAETGKIPVAALASLPDAVALRVIRLMAGSALSFDHTDAVLRLCRSGSGTLSLPGGQVRSDGSELAFGTPRVPVLSEAELEQDIPLFRPVSLPVPVRQHGESRAAAQRFKAQRSAAREQVQHPGVHAPALQHIEQVFPDPVQRRPGVQARRRLDLPASGASSDNSQHLSRTVRVSSAVPESSAAASGLFFPAFPSGPCSFCFPRSRCLSSRGP